jgi:hypothetical protein
LWLNFHPLGKNGGITRHKYKNSAFITITAGIENMASPIRSGERIAIPILAGTIVVGDEAITPPTLPPNFSIATVDVIATPPAKTDDKIAVTQLAIIVSNQVIGDINCFP